MRRAGTSNHCAADGPARVTGARIIRLLPARVHGVIGDAHGDPRSPPRRALAAQVDLLAVPRRGGMRASVELPVIGTQSRSRRCMPGRGRDGCWWCFLSGLRAAHRRSRRQFMPPKSALVKACVSVEPLALPPKRPPEQVVNADARAAAAEAAECIRAG